MKPVVTLALLLLSLCIYAQPVQVTNTSGSAIYDGITISVTSVGGVATTGTVCGGTTTDYWVSPPATAPGLYLYICSAPVYTIQLHAYNINGGATGHGEYLQVQINGAPYTLTAADVTSYSECGSRGTGICYIDSGRLYGPAGTAAGNMNGGDITIHYCAGINSFAVYCGNPDSGIQYNVYVDTVRQPEQAIISGATDICEGSSAFLTATATGGTWTSSNTAVATVITSGTNAIITGGFSGTAVISYTYTNSCGTAITTENFTVGAAPSGDISGPHIVCIGQTITLTAVTTGGTWTSSNTTIATVGSANGVVSGLRAGVTTITYNVSAGSGCSAAGRFTVTVSPMPSPDITGGTGMCLGATRSFSGVPAGGVWSSSNTAVATIAVNPLGGETVYGSGNGVTTIAYAVSNACATVTATVSVTVSAPHLPAPIAGPTNVCTGHTITLADATQGTWSASNSHATIDPFTGVLSGVTAGIDTVAYTPDTLSGCFTGVATYTVTVNAAPVVPPLTGPYSVCTGSTIMLSSATPSGTWSSSNTAVATVGTTGVVAGASAGTTTISYTLTNGCGTAYATAAVTVNPSPVPSPISGPSLVCTGFSVTLTDTAHGTWSASNAHATAGAGTGTVTGVTAGVDTITFTPLPRGVDALGIQ